MDRLLDFNKFKQNLGTLETGLANGEDVSHLPFAVANSLIFTVSITQSTAIRQKIGSQEVPPDDLSAVSFGALSGLVRKSGTEEVTYHKNTYTHIHTHTHTYTYTYVHTYIHILIFTHTNVHTHILTHTHTQLQQMGVSMPAPFGDSSSKE
jgi:hypothetical protein